MIISIEFLFSVIENCTLTMSEKMDIGLCAIINFLRLKGSTEVVHEHKHTTLGEGASFYYLMVNKWDAEFKRGRER